MLQQQVRLPESSYPAAHKQWLCRASRLRVVAEAPSSSSSVPSCVYIGRTCLLSDQGKTLVGAANDVRRTPRIKKYLRHNFSHLLCARLLNRTKRGSSCWLLVPTAAHNDEGCFLQSTITATGACFLSLPEMRDPSPAFWGRILRTKSHLYININVVEPPYVEGV